MNNILLSNESYELLKKIHSGAPIDLSHPDCQAQVEQLLEYRFIENQIIEYDLSGTSIRPVFSEYQITELGKGYIAGREADANLVRSISEIADSAKTRADSAAKKARKASFTGMISLIVSISMLLISAMSNYDKIISFFNALFIPK